MGYVPHPDVPTLFIPEAKAEKYGVNPDAPAYYRKPYRRLSRAEKVRGLRVELARRSLSNNGRYAMEASAIHQDVFDGQPSDSHVRDLMDRAVKADGFSTDVRGGTERLRVDLRRATDDLVATAKDVHDDGGDDGPASPRDRHDGQQDGVDGGKPDASPGGGTDDGGSVDVDTDMDALMNATPVTDGGSDG